MANKPLKPKEVTDLLSKLKSTTPDYPADLMAARRAAFVKKAIAVKLEGKGPGGKGGQHGGSGGSGTTAGGSVAGLRRDVKSSMTISQTTNGLYRFKI